MTHQVKTGLRHPCSTIDQWTQVIQVIRYAAKQLGLACHAVAVTLIRGLFTHAYDMLGVWHTIPLHA